MIDSTGKIDPVSQPEWKIRGSGESALGGEDVPVPLPGCRVVQDRIVAALLDRRVVHKTAASEVLLTTFEQCGVEAWTFGYELPRAHWERSRERDQHVPLILGLELVRQAGIAVAHLGVEIPLDWKFILQRIEFSWVEGPHAFPEYAPLTGEVNVQVTGWRRRRGMVSGLQAAMLIHRNGDVIAEGGGDMDFVPPETYRMLRRHAAPHGTQEQRGEILTAPSLETDSLVAHLGWDANDPFDFDHRSDHVPGMVLVRAGIRAHALLMPAVVPTSVGLQAQRFVEYAPAPQVQSRADSPGSTLTVITQGGASTAQIYCRGNSSAHRNP